jgi:hypothetical protein
VNWLLSIAGTFFVLAIAAAFIPPIKKNSSDIFIWSQCLFFIDWCVPTNATLTSFIRQ